MSFNLSLSECILPTLLQQGPEPTSPLAAATVAAAAPAGAPSSPLKTKIPAERSPLKYRIERRWEPKVQEIEEEAEGEEESQHQQQLQFADVERAVKVRNTFLDYEVERSSSLEPFYRERKVQSAPASPWKDEVELVAASCNVSIGEPFSPSPWKEFTPSRTGGGDFTRTTHCPSDGEPDFGMDSPCSPPRIMMTPMHCAALAAEIAATPTQSHTPIMAPTPTSVVSATSTMPVGQYSMQTCMTAPYAAVAPQPQPQPQPFACASSMGNPMAAAAAAAAAAGCGYQFMYHPMAAHSTLAYRAAAAAAVAQQHQQSQQHLQQAPKAAASSSSGKPSSSSKVLSLAAAIDGPFTQKPAPTTLSLAQGVLKEAPRSAPLFSTSGAATMMSSAPTAPPTAAHASMTASASAAPSKPPSATAAPTPATSTAVATAPVVVDEAELGDLPSLGSKGHAIGDCKPCAFFHTAGCTNGAACQFCHLCDAEEKKRRRKEKIQAKRLASKLRAEAEDEEGAEGVAGEESALVAPVEDAAASEPSPAEVVA